MKRIGLICIAIITIAISCYSSNQPIEMGAQQFEEYFPLLKDKRIAIYSNHTGMLGDKHLIDVLLENQFKVTTIFSPEHGFRGSADAGEHVSSSKDPKTGVPILSLYDGKSKGVNTEAMKEFDLLVIDIQDVGLRFYTYYITMIHLMDACAQHNKPVVLLDRPNPNGHYVDGPILDMKHKSGVGYLPIPVVHGMTLGELALMANGENWLSDNRSCDLTVVKCKNYTHQSVYELPIAPSPNLPNMRSIYLYPSVCLFEGTPVSLGRGTDSPFQIYGHPKMKGKYKFSFTPRSVAGAKNPPLLNQTCYGVDLRTLPNDEIYHMGLNLAYVIDAYHAVNLGEKFFRPFFTLLIGVDYVKEMIMEGKSAEEIQAMWKEDVVQFKEQRKPYLLYPEN